MEMERKGIEKQQGIGVVWWCVARFCLRNPFRESAERGTQTSEWGKNSVSLPVLHSTFSRPSSAAILSLSRYVSHVCRLSFWFPFVYRSASLSLSRLRGNQAKHKLGRHLVAGNIYKP